MSRPRLYGPGPHLWRLSARFPELPDVTVAGHGLIELAEQETEHAIAGRLVRELGGPDLERADSVITFTIRPARQAR